MVNPICNTVFDSRDLIEYYDELKDTILCDYNSFKSEQDEDWEDIDDIDLVDDEYRNEVDNDRIEEYKGLTDFIEELEEYSEDFEYGASIIHEDYWVEYYEELCKDIGEIPKDLPWYISNHIDWDGVASEITADYTQVEYEGDNYYIR